jgi:hypothetical protein
MNGRPNHFGLKTPMKPFLAPEANVLSHQQFLFTTSSENIGLVAFRLGLINRAGHPIPNRLPHMVE